MRPRTQPLWRRLGPVALALLLAATVGASAFAVCLKSDWPRYNAQTRPSDLSAESYLGFVIFDADTHIAANHPLRATWVEVRAQAIACRTNVHTHQARTCRWYWERCKNAAAQSSNGDNAAYCFSELNHPDPVLVPPPPAPVPTRAR